jgi:tRNA(Arg) A34 adenosine deaminase TadA
MPDAAGLLPAPLLDWALPRCFQRLLRRRRWTPIGASSWKKRPDWRPNPFKRAGAVPLGAVIVKDGEIIGRGQNRVLLTGCPVYHAEVTAIIDASNRLNPKGLLGSDYGPGTMLQLIPRPADSPDLVPERAKMLKGCEIYINGAPCPMCMSAIYWSRIDHLYFGASLEDTSHIGFSDEFQYQDFRLPWGQRKGIAATPNFEREMALAAYQAWENKQDHHYY